MIWGYNWVLLTFTAVIINIITDKFPIKHPVQFIGDFILWFEKIAYKNSIFRGAILLILLVFIVGFLAISIQLTLIKFPAILGMLASFGLASKTLKTYVNKVLLEEDSVKRRENLALLVTRNTQILDDKKVYSSLLETYSENLSDGLISPLFYLIIFGFPGIMIFKTVSTLDSMIGYKNERYEKFGKCSAILDDILNFIPARITAFLIWILSCKRISWKKLSGEAKKYSSSPNAGYPVVAAAYNLGVVLGGPVYYGNTLVNKAEIGEEKTGDYAGAVHRFMQIHMVIDIIIVVILMSLITSKIFGT